MKVYVTVVVEPDGYTGYEPEYRERFFIEAGSAPTQEICENAQVATYNAVEELVEKARVDAGRLHKEMGG